MYASVKFYVRRWMSAQYSVPRLCTMPCQTTGADDDLRQRAAAREGAVFA